MAADIAASAGVLICIGTIPVPRSRFGAAWLTAPSIVKASVPVASTVQIDRYPSVCASSAIEVIAFGPKTPKLPKVTPIDFWSVTLLISP